MRIAIAGLWHETNTFSSVAADYASFEQDTLVRGGDLIDEYADCEATIAGFLEAARRLSFDAVPLVHARTGPIGTITDEAFERLSTEILDRLREGGDWDAVLLANHGAAVSERYRDVDAQIAIRVREVVGPRVPIGIALDLHANISPELVDATTVLNTYQTNPHLDARERGYEVAALIVRTVRGDITPVQWLERPPLIINIVRQWSGEAPMSGLLIRARALERTPGILGTSVVQGYPYADVPQMGMSFHAMADGDVDLARRAAQSLASAAWAERASMDCDLGPVEDTLAQAAELVAQRPGRPVVLMDVGDNILGGSAADSTVLLERARELRTGGLLQTLYDPEAVHACCEAGIGAKVNMSVGAKTDRLHGRPFPVEARIRTIAEGRYEDPGPTHGGFRYFDDGLRALIDTDDGHTLLLTSERSSNSSREQWYSLGVHPERAPLVVAKGVVSPRPAYEPIAHRIVLANTPGLTTADLGSLPYQYRPRPVFPLDAGADYLPGEPSTRAPDSCES